jgi:RNA 2',3'-cyclic 3'-phosphodiesterase
MNSKRLFFALWPDDRQRDRLRNTIGPLAGAIEGDPVYRANWHVTLAFIGEFRDDRIPALMEAARAVPVELFRLRFDRVEFWPRPKLAVLLAKAVPEECEQLVAALNVVIQDAGVAIDDRRFRPHITIARRARAFEAQRLAQPAVVEWRGFELVESVPEPGGPSYRPLKQ